MKIYLVGGAVRDELLGLQVTERDWVVIGASPEDMEAKGYKAVGKDFPVFLHPESKEEYALARTERKKGRGYKGFEIYTSPDVSLEDDLYRRDLTINAIAKDENGEVIDPYGGVQDIENKIIRHVSIAYAEDPLRVLRTARFVAKLHPLGFTLAHETLLLMRQIVTTRELKEIPLERVWLETNKALQTNAPSEYFEVLKNSNALAQLFPNFYYQYTDEKCSTLGLHALKIVSEKHTHPDVRFASFIGGLFFNEPSDGSEGGDEYSNIIKFSDTYPISNACKKLLILTVRLQHACHNSLKLNKNELFDLLKKLDTKRNTKRFFEFLDICEAIYTSANHGQPYKQRVWLKKAATEIEKVSIDTWIQEKITGEEFANNIKQAQLELLANLINARD